LADCFTAGILYDQFRLIVRAAFQNASKQPREFFIVIAPQDRLTSIVDDQPRGKIFDKCEGRGVVQPTIHFALLTIDAFDKAKKESSAYRQCNSLDDAA
jgi:hypothetical protein